MTIRVILADDQPLVRAGLRMLIEQTPGIDVAGEAATGAEAVQLARDADVVVMDIRMPGVDGIEATQLITAGDTRARVARLLAKLGARDRVQLVITAYEAGLVPA
jgi:DNA-binding NarL/FixJ family response regulator